MSHYISEFCHKLIRKVLHSNTIRFNLEEPICQTGGFWNDSYSAIIKTTQSESSSIQKDLKTNCQGTYSSIFQSHNFFNFLCLHKFVFFPTFPVFMFCTPSSETLLKFVILCNFSLSIVTHANPRDKDNKKLVNNRST